MRKKVWFSLAISAVAALAPSSVWADEAEDHATANRIAAALKESGKLQGYRIGVSCKDGTAWLEGDVTSNEQGIIALQVARGTEGVEKVVNRLMCPAPAAKSPETEAPNVATGPMKDAPQPAVAEAVPGEQIQAQLTSSETGVATQPEVTPPLASRQVPTPAAPQQMVPQDAIPRQAMRQAAMPRQAAPQQAMQQQAMQQQAMQQQAMQQQAMRQQAMPRQAMRQQAMPHPYQQTSAMQPIPATPISAGGPAVMGHPAAMGGPVGMGGPVPTAHPAGPAVYDQPYMPNYSWPSYAAYPNYAAVTYPKQYSPTAWPYIGPFYPYPQVPLGWRKVTLEWDDGWWMLDFKD